MPHYNEIKEAILAVSSDLANKQVPLIMQPIWKTDRKLTDLEENCLDVFVWSNLSVIQMALRETSPDDDISRNQLRANEIFNLVFDK